MIALERHERKQIEMYGEETAESADQPENWAGIAGERERQGSSGPIHEVTGNAQNQVPDEGRRII